MIKHLSLLLMFGLLGCHSEPQFPNPIKPTENKSETIQKWLGDFYCGKDGYIDWYYAGPMQMVIILGTLCHLTFMVQFYHIVYSHKRNYVHPIQVIILK